MALRVPCDDESTLFLDALETSWSCMTRRTSPETHLNGAFFSGGGCTAGFLPTSTTESSPLLLPSSSTSTTSSSSSSRSRTATVDLDAAPAAANSVNAAVEAEAVAVERLQKGGCEDMDEVKTLCSMTDGHDNPPELPHENR